MRELYETEEKTVQETYIELQDNVNYYLELFNIQDSSATVTPNSFLLVNYFTSDWIYIPALKLLVEGFTQQHPNLQNRSFLIEVKIYNWKLAIVRAQQFGKVKNRDMTITNVVDFVSSFAYVIHSYIESFENCRTLFNGIRLTESNFAYPFFQQNDTHLPNIRNVSIQLVEQFNDVFDAINNKMKIIAQRVSWSTIVTNLNDLSDVLEFEVLVLEQNLYILTFALELYNKTDFTKKEKAIILPALTCTNELLQPHLDNPDEAIKVLYQMLGFILINNMCHELQKGYIQDYKLRTLINRVKGHVTKQPEMVAFLNQVLSTLETLCTQVGQLGESPEALCVDKMRVSESILNEISKLYWFLMYNQVPKPGKVSQIPLKEKDLITALETAELHFNKMNDIGPSFLSQLADTAALLTY
jgi:hypothetical protein